MTGLKFCGDCRHFDDRRMKCRAGVRGITWYVSNHCVRFDGVEVARGLTLAEAVAFCEEDGR